MAGDEVYGAEPDLRMMLHDRRIGYVLAVSCDRRVPTEAGMRAVSELRFPPSLRSARPFLDECQRAVHASCDDGCPLGRHRVMNCSV